MLAPETEFEFPDAVDIVSGKPVGAFAVLQIGTPGAESKALQPGASYLLLLAAVPHFRSASGAPGYVTSQGLYGRFAITDETVSAVCPNYDNPAEPIHAIGSGVSVAAFEAVLKRVRNISG